MRVESQDLKKKIKNALKHILKFIHQQNPSYLITERSLSYGIMFKVRYINLIEFITEIQSDSVFRNRKSRTW